MKRTLITPDGELPVVEGKHSFIIQPNEDDIKNGIPGDPTRCMFALALKRMYGSTYVWVAKTMAYVSLKGTNGRLQVEHYSLSPAAREEQTRHDADKKVTGEAVIFKKPEGSKRLDYQSENYRRRKNKKITLIKGKASGKSGKSKSKKADALTSLRSSGSGSVQFPFRKEATSR